MKIERLNIYNLSLPFSFSFSHAAKKRSLARNIVVEMEADRGRSGDTEKVHHDPMSRGNLRKGPPEKRSGS